MISADCDFDFDSSVATGWMSDERHPYYAVVTELGQRNFPLSSYSQLTADVVGQVVEAAGGTHSVSEYWKRIACS